MMVDDGGGILNKIETLHSNVRDVESIQWFEEVYDLSTVSDRIVRSVFGERLLVIEMPPVEVEGRRPKLGIFNHRKQSFSESTSPKFLCDASPDVPSAESSADIFISKTHAKQPHLFQLR